MYVFKFYLLVNTSVNNVQDNKITVLNATLILHIKYNSLYVHVNKDSMT